MNDQTKTAIAFIAGAAIGAAVTYLLTSDKGEELADDFKDLARKVKDNIAEQFSNIQTRKEAREEAQMQEDMMGV
jgi:gas vesicle protein